MDTIDSPPWGPISASKNPYDLEDCFKVVVNFARLEFLSPNWNFIFSHMVGIDHTVYPCVNLFIDTRQIKIFKTFFKILSFFLKVRSFANVILLLLLPDLTM